MTKVLIIFTFIPLILCSGCSYEKKEFDNYNNYCDSRYVYMCRQLDRIATALEKLNGENNEQIQRFN